jgi:ATP-dependent exoDNAse (exonuclease V) beta subunit
VRDWLNNVLPEGTPEGQARAVTRDGDLVTVGAGAGTGKTWVLSARFIRLLLSDPECLPQNILTLTFTEAAAREMQERIYRRASEPGVFAPQRWRAVREGFDEAWISTIHSFASRLIRESGLALDVDPRSGVVAAPQEEAFWGALERALEEMDLPAFTAAYPNERLRRTAALLSADEALPAALEKWGPSALRNLARSVTELHASLGHTWETLLTWADDAVQGGRPDPQAAAAHEAVLELLRPRWNAAWRLWAAIFSELRSLILTARADALAKAAGGAKQPHPAVSLAEVLERWSDALSDENKKTSPELQRAFYLDLCSNLSGNNSKLFKAIAERLGQTSSKWRESQADWAALSALPSGSPFPAPEQRLRAALLRLSALAWGAWDEAKRRGGLLSFSDMIRFAAQSIAKDSRVKGFKHVLIDEFQDTDPLQDSMIQALRGKEGAKLFLVGDPKQAIYRFRHADLTLFADYVLQSRASGAGVSLDVSFRTRECLMNTINSLFGRIWKDGLGAGNRMRSLKFEPLSVSGEPGRESASIPPFTLLLSVKKSGEGRERLDRALAQTFARYVAEGYTVWDKGEGCLRPVSWRDFAVLTPTRAEYDILEAAFAEEGVPAAFEKSMSYFSRGEVGDVVSLLRAAAFPDDETALAGWLCSPLSGVPQREAEACLWGGVQFFRERLPEAAERLTYLRRLGALKGPAALLSHLLEDRTWLAAFAPSLRKRVTRNVNRAVTLARQYENGVSPSLAGCAQWLDMALRSDRAIEEPEWMEDADAVRVMTVHASKGLEFPVAAVMRMERSPHEVPSASLAPSKNMGVAFSSIPDMMLPGGTPEADEVSAWSLRWERTLAEQAELEESARLFYVAATRARDSLILCGLVSKNAKGERSVREDSWLSWTLSWLAKEQNTDWRDIQGPPLVFAEELEKGSLPPKRSEPEEPAPFSPLPLPEAETVLSSFSATSFALFQWCPLAWRRRHRQGLDLRWEVPDEGSDEEAAGGSEMGTLAHWILARWNLREETLGGWVSEALTPRLPLALRDTWRSEKNRKALSGWLAAFARSDEGRALAEAAGRAALFRREGAFRVVAGDEDSEREARLTRLVGAMDVFWRDGGFWHVRDYKITLSDNAPAELYRAQLAFYALAVKLLAQRRSLPFEGVDVGLLFLREGGRLGEMRSFSLSEDWTTLQDQVREAARAAAQGPWPPSGNCPRCPWRAACPRPRNAE